MVEEDCVIEEGPFDLIDEVHDIVPDNQPDDEIVDKASKSKSGLIFKNQVTEEDVTDPKYILNHSCLEVLISQIIYKSCTRKGCHHPVRYSTKTSGSAVTITWVGI